MPKSCYVNGCKGWGNSSLLVSYHRVPLDSTKRKIWIRNINRPECKNWDTVRICSRHFIDGKPTKENPHPVLEMGRPHVPVITGQQLRVESATVDALVDIHAGADRYGRQDELSAAEALLDLALGMHEPAVADTVGQDREVEEGTSQQQAITPHGSSVSTAQLWTPPTPPRMRWPFDPETPKRARLQATVQLATLDPVLEPPPPSSPSFAAAPSVDARPSTSLGIYGHTRNQCTAVGDHTTRPELARRHSAGDPVQGTRQPEDMQALPSPPYAGPSHAEKEERYFLQWPWFVGFDERTRYYTGMPDYRTLSDVYEEIVQDAAKLSLWEPDKVKTTNKRRKLDIQEELLLTLIRVKRNFDNTHLADIYDVNISYVSRVLRVWIPFLAKKLGSWVMWVFRDEQRPVPCMALFPRCVGIIDCFELFIEKPGSQLQQQAYWSQYKHHHTVKFLICISPNGSVMFISPAYGGRTSDIEIVKDSKEGFLDNFIRGDALLADRGFNVKEFLLMNYGVQLLIPKFLTVPQLPRADVDSARKMSSARIHVERVIGQLRTFKILHDICPVHMLEFLDDIAVICCAILNMNPPIVPK